MLQVSGPCPQHCSLKASPSLEFRGSGSWVGGERPLERVGRGVERGAQAACLPSSKAAPGRVGRHL